MHIKNFQEFGHASVGELIVAIGSRVKQERHNQGCTQKEFAERCSVTLRTYKRFESGHCDSLEVFLRLVITFNRQAALELLFPPKEVNLDSRNAVSVLAGVVARLKESQ